MNNSTLATKTQTDISKQLDIDRTQYLNYKKLNELMPELQDLVSKEQLSPTIAHKV